MIPAVAAIAASLWAAVAGVAAPADPATQADPASITVDIGASRMELPGPPGWVELTTRREIIRKLFESGMPEDNRHLATFVTPEAAAGLDGGVDLPQWASATTVRALEQRDMTTAEFLQLRIAIRSQWTQIVEQVRRQVAEEQKRASERVEENLGIDVDLSVGALESLGVFLDEPGAIGALMTMQSGGTVAGEASTAEMAVAIMMLHLRSRLVVLSVYRVGATPEDLEAAKVAAMAWRDAVRAANTEALQPAM